MNRPINEKPYLTIKARHQKSEKSEDVNDKVDYRVTDASKILLLNDTLYHEMYGYAIEAAKKIAEHSKRNLELKLTFE